MKRAYWAVKWGDNVRITTDKTDNAVTAAKMLYGMATSDMRAKLLSTKVADIQNTKKRKALLENPEGWVEVKA